MAACATAGAVLVTGAAAVPGGPAEEPPAQPAPGVVAEAATTAVVCPTECTHLDEPLTEQLTPTTAALSVRVLGPVAPGAEVVAAVDGSDAPVLPRATDDRTYRAVVPVVPNDAVGCSVEVWSPVRRVVMGTHLSEAWPPA